MHINLAKYQSPKFALATGLLGRNLHVATRTAGVRMALVAVLCSKCSHIGFARADALPRVLVCSRCHRQQRFEPPPKQGQREQDWPLHIEQAMADE
jgi:hypothetical protein